MLFADAETVITAVFSGVALLLTGAAGAWAVMRRTKTETNAQAEEARAKIDSQRRKEELKERKDSLHECWELYEEQKNAVIDLRVELRLANRKIRRMERAIVAAGIDLSELDDPDEDSGHVVPPTDPTEGPSGGSTSGPVPPRRPRPRN